MNENEARQRARNRARARLRALGIDVDQMDHEQIRQAWEYARRAYINGAQAGIHMRALHLEDDPLPGACLHARFGMLKQALADFHDEWPDGWSPPRVEWPHHGHQQRATVAVTQDAPAALPPGT